MKLRTIDRLIELARKHEPELLQALMDERLKISVNMTLQEHDEERRSQCPVR